MTDTNFYSGETLYATALDAAFGECIDRGGDTMSGMLTLAMDPVNPLDAVPMRYLMNTLGGRLSTLVITSDTAPTGVLPGTLWWDTTRGDLFILYQDPNSTQWVSATASGVSSQNVISVLACGAKGDGATDDTAAIQTTLNNYAGKSIILIPNTGNPYMVSGLYLPSNTELIVNGTVMLRGAQAAAPINVLSNIKNVYIHGYGTVDGNGTAQTATVGSVYVYQASYVTIEGVTVQNAKAWNLNVVASNHVRVNRVSLLGGVNANEFAQGCNDCTITNSLIDGVTDDGGFTFYGGVTNSSIVNCIARNCPLATGIGVYNDAGQSAACSHITIANNICYNNGTGGIGVSRDLTATATHTNITIIGNRCYLNNTYNATYADIWVSTGAAVVVSGNLLGGSGHGSNPTYGVFVGVNSALVSITGNTIYDEGQGGTQGSGVFIQQAPDVLVSGNVISDNQATKSMQSAISGIAGPRNVIGSNEFGTFIGAANQLTMLADTVMLTGPLVVPGVTANNAPIEITSSGTVTNSYIFKTTGNGTDQNVWDSEVNGSLLQFRAVNDAQTLANTWLQATRSGYTISNITLAGTNIVLQGAVTLSADPTAALGAATKQYVDAHSGGSTPATVPPLMDGTATVGTSLLYARQDHVHPSDTSRAPLASPALTGAPTSTTPATADNSTAIATTAFVKAQGYGAPPTPASLAPVMDGTAAVGTSLLYARQDHVHPTDTSRAPLASPTFTGTVTIPAGAAITGYLPLTGGTLSGALTVQSPVNASGTTGYFQSNMPTWPGLSMNATTPNKLWQIGVDGGGNFGVLDNSDSNWRPITIVPGNPGSISLGGVTTVNATQTTGWSSDVVGHQLTVQSTNTNPGIAISDSTGNANYVGIWNWAGTGGSLAFAGMPLLTDSTTAPNLWMVLQPSIATIYKPLTVSSGRVVSQNAGNRAGFAVWNTSSNAGIVLNSVTTSLYFSTSDANGNPVTDLAYMDNGGNLVLINGSFISSNGEISVGAAGVVVSGSKVVGTQITGYGTPTGPVKLASFPGASATLAQTSAMVAQLITDLKTHGLLGA